MLSNKMTFSLMSLITILALAFVVSPAIAADFTTKVTQVGTLTYQVNADGTALSTEAITVDLDIEFGKPIGGIVGDTAAGAVNITATSFDKFGQVVTATIDLLDLPVTDDDPDDAYPARTASKRRIRLSITAANPTAGATDPPTALVTKIIVSIPKFQTIDPSVAAADNMSEAKFHTITPLQPAPLQPSRPTVVSIQRLRPGSQLVLSAFEEKVVTGAFDIRIVLTELPSGGFKLADHVNVAGGTASNLVVGKTFKREGLTDVASMTLVPHPFEGDYDHGIGTLPGSGTGTDTVPLPTNISAAAGDQVYHQFRVTITPHNRSTVVTVSIKAFSDGETPSYKYDPALFAGGPNGRHYLTVDVERKRTALGAGYQLYLPKGDPAGKVPVDGFHIVTSNKVNSGIDWSAEKDADDKTKVENVNHKQTPAQLFYNVRQTADLPNLETFLANNGTIDLVAYAGKPADAAPAANQVYISEVMWGSDASQDPVNSSQWIEIANRTTGVITIDENRWALWFYQAHEEPADSYAKEDGTLGTLQDRIGTVDSETEIGWPIAGIGQSGRTNIIAGQADVVAIAPTQKLVSMSRAMEADTSTGATAGAMVPADGTMMSSWTPSSAPSVNFILIAQGRYDASPGSTGVTFPDAPIPDPVLTPASVAMPEDIMITEIMVDTGDGRLPQWIELTNVSGADVSLAGWSLIISNSNADADAVGASVGINLSGTLGVGGGEDAGGTLGKSLLLVSWAGRNSRNLDGSERVVDVSDAVGETGRYKLISDMAFMIALIPPQETGVLTYGDAAGNLGADEAWDIPMSDGGRSSLIRREMDIAGMATMGTAANGWVLASSTALVSGPATWYGSDEDAGTPGYDAGGPLPVSLSHFRPARDKDTGAAVITWSTQSELNNAGFFIKRSQQRDGQFKIINAAMIQGAGTTSEKQFYTYTDTTAQPNVVYYYQIEDVSLDGNRQTLTNGIRLKGHIGAAGKLTTLWGDLKTSQ